MSTIKITPTVLSRSLAAARGVLQRQPWTTGAWFRDANTGQDFRRMDTETGYMTVDGKSIPFTKTTEVCAMGAVEAALIEDSRLTPAQRKALYARIEEILTAKANELYGETYDDGTLELWYEDYLGMFKSDQRDGFIPAEVEPDTFEEYKRKLRAESSRYASIIDLNDEADKDTVLSVFDAAVADFTDGTARDLALSA